MATGRTSFCPIVGSDLKWLSLKTAFLIAMASGKPVSKLQALSVHESCLRWAPDGTSVSLWPHAAFVPKVASTRIAQPLELARFRELDSTVPLCPVRALEDYMAGTSRMRRSDRLSVCYAGPRRGQALSAQRLSHWVVEVINHAYVPQGLSLPVEVRCHSIQGLYHGVFH